MITDTHVTNAAYIAALEKKLYEAERALYGFRRIFEHYTREQEAEKHVESGAESYITAPEESCLE